MAFIVLFIAGVIVLSIVAGSLQGNSYATKKRSSEGEYTPMSSHVAYGGDRCESTQQDSSFSDGGCSGGD